MYWLVYAQELFFGGCRKTCFVSITSSLPCMLLMSPRIILKTKSFVGPFWNCIRTCDNWFNYYPHLCLLLKSATLCEMSSKWFPISLKEREETKNNSQGLIAKVWMPTKQAIFIVSESIFIIFVFSESITWALAWSPWSSHCHPFHPAPPFVPPNNKIFRFLTRVERIDSKLAVALSAGIPWEG